MTGRSPSRRATADQFVALAIGQVIALMVCDPWWKALFLIPLLMAIALPFWWIERGLERCGPTGKGAGKWVLAAIAVAVLIAWVQWRIFAHLAGIQ